MLQMRVQRAVQHAAAAPSIPPLWMTRCLGGRVPAYTRAVSVRFQFANCNQAARAFQQRQARRQRTAWTQLGGFRYRTTPLRFVQNANGTFSVSATLSWSLGTGHVMYMPQWVNIPAADQRAWNRMISALRAHEEGHIQISRCLVQDLPPEPLTATGRTRQDAENAFNALIARRATFVQQEDARRQAAYDARTNSGANQSALGGRNAILDCAHP